MGARLNRVDPQDFVTKPVVFVDKTGRHYTRAPGPPRKVPRDVRKQLYQLDLTIRETKAEIARLLTEHGVSNKSRQWTNYMAKVRRERGA